MSVPAYVEHVALRVRDPAAHLAFFRDALGMDVREIDGPQETPRQIWLHGGLQLVSDPDFADGDGRFLHLGLMVEDLDAAIAAARRHGAQSLPRGENWLALPDGLVIALQQAGGDAVARIRAIDPRG